MTAVLYGTGEWVDPGCSGGDRSAWAHLADRSDAVHAPGGHRRASTEAMAVSVVVLQCPGCGASSRVDAVDTAAPLRQERYVSTSRTTGYVSVRTVPSNPLPEHVRTGSPVPHACAGHPIRKDAGGPLTRARPRLPNEPAFRPEPINSSTARKWWA